MLASRATADPSVRDASSAHNPPPAPAPTIAMPVPVSVSVPVPMRMAVTMPAASKLLALLPRRAVTVTFTVALALAVARVRRPRLAQRPRSGPGPGHYLSDHVLPVAPDDGRGQHEGRHPLWVGALVAGAAVRAEAREEEAAHLGHAHVALGTILAQRTEAVVVVRAAGDLGVRVDVQIQALLAVAAVAVAHVEVAFGHLAPVAASQHKAVES